MNIRYVAAVFFVSLTVCLSAQTPQNERRAIVVGGDFNFPPYELLDKNDKPIGYNVELAEAVAEVMGFQVKFRLGKWSKVKEWLNSGEVDIIEGMAYSQERAALYNFSFPHTETWRCVFVRKNSAYHDISELQSATLAAQTGDVSEEYLQTIKFKGKVVELPSQEDALLMLDSGQVEAALVNYRNGKYIINERKLEHIAILDKPFDPKFYCFAAKKPNFQLINDFNSGLAILQKTGRLKEIQKKWFGQEEQETLSSETLVRRMMYIIVPLSLFLVISLSGLWYLRRQVRYKSNELKRELEGRLKYESELNREYKMFVNGPVIVYKLLSDLQTIPYISDNVRQFGYEPKDLMTQRKGFRDLVFSEDWPRLSNQLQRDINDEMEFSAKQYRVVTVNGNICWVFDYSMLVREQDNTTWLYGYMLDISAQKSLEAELLEAKEKAETANIAKGHFLSNISHEIRTPLNGIIGFIQVLQNMAMLPNQKEYLDLIQLSGRNLMKIVNDILDFSKMESGKLDLIVTDFNPRFLIEDIIKTFTTSSTKRQVDIRARLSEQLPVIIFGDMMRLRQILINLMQNALKFTEKGYVEISADIYSQYDDDIRLLISVKDTGIGIDPVKQRDIFDDFIQVDASITRKYGGTGLGLSIVKKLVELMGGFIWVESEQFKGSSFFFIVPFRTRLAEQPRFEQQLLEPEKEREPLPPMRILIAEDEPINQMVTQKQLERWNQTVAIANNGAEALELMKTQKFDCILMDIQMPELDGVTATHRIREAEKETGDHITIIAFTAAAMAGDKERFLAAGMDDYISKPIDVDNLYRILSKVNNPALV